MLELTVDTQIVLIGNGMSNVAASSEHARLVDSFLSAVYLALDEEKQVITEYERKLGSDSEGRKWLERLFREDRIRLHSLPKLPRKMRVELEKTHFDLADRKFVCLAMATNSKRLVAEESDYSREVRKVLKKLEDIVVCSAAEACEWIDTAPTEDPPESQHD